MSTSFPEFEAQFRACPEPKDKCKLVLEEVPGLINDDVNKALKYFQEAFRIAKKEGLKQQEKSAILYENICRFILYEDLNKIKQRFAEVKEYFEVLNKEGKTFNKNEYILTLYYLSSAYYEIGDYIEGINICEKANYYVRLYKLKKEESDLYEMLGKLYSRLRRYNTASDFYNKSIGIKKTIDDVNGIASTLIYMARNDASNEKNDEALEKLNEAANSRDNTIRFRALLGIAEINIKGKKYEEAEDTYLECNKLIGSIQSTRCKYLYYDGKGEIKLLLGHKKEALDDLHEALKIAQKAKSKHDIYHTSKTVSECYEAMGEFDKALSFYKEFAKIKSKLQEADVIMKESLELKKLNFDLNKANNHVYQSINAAKYIQNALLPSKAILKEYLKDYFLIFKPRDIVSGDFYWTGVKDNKLWIAVADCTGHGVPGAFTSMLGMSMLNEAIYEEKKCRPDLILNMLRIKIIDVLKQGAFSGNHLPVQTDNTEVIEEERVDRNAGMDMVLISIDLRSMSFEFAGAKNPLFLFRKGKLIEIKPDRMPIGNYPKMDKFKFIKRVLKEDDIFYMFSDGYPDQNGGEQGERLNKKGGFKQLLTEIHKKPFKEQEKILVQTLEDWQNHPHPSGDKHDQTDDITVLGFKINLE